MAQKNIACHDANTSGELELSLLSRGPMLHEHDNIEMDMTCGQYLKIHMTRV